MGGPPAEECQVASKFLDDVLTSSQMMRRESLCVVRDKLCWCLYIDVLCLDYDGNTLDACVTAMTAALRNVVLPSADYNTETEEITVDTKSKQSLTMRCTPISTSFIIFDDNILLSDGTAEEESLATGTVSVVTSDEENVCYLHKPGGSPLTAEHMATCISKAKLHSQSVRSLIRQAEVDVDR